MNLESAKALANEIRAHWPEKAVQIDALIAAAEAEGKSDGLKITGSIKLKLEKFDGEYEPRKQPIEVIETEDHF